MATYFTYLFYVRFCFTFNNQFHKPWKWKTFNVLPEHLLKPKRLNLKELTSSGAFLLEYLYPLKKIYIILQSWYRVLQTQAGNMNFNDSNAISELFREHQLKSFTLGIQDNKIYGLHIRFSNSILINFRSKIRILLM